MRSASSIWGTRPVSTSIQRHVADARMTRQQTIMMVVLIDSTYPCTWRSGLTLTASGQKLSRMLM